MLLPDIKFLLLKVKVSQLTTTPSFIVISFTESFDELQPMVLRQIEKNRNDKK